MIVRLLGLASGCALLALGLTVTPAAADTVKKKHVTEDVDATGAHRASRYYRRAPQVRGYVQRRGGYSYSSGDVINIYGSSRSPYRGAFTYRDRALDTQTPFGPFDSGFFFDSGIGPRGGNSPYPN